MLQVRSVASDEAENVMSFSTAFLSMMTSTLKISTRSGHDNYGKATFAATTTNFRARIVEKPGYVPCPPMEEVAYRHVAWVRSTGATSITASDRVTLPDGTTPPVVGVEVYPDEDGVNNRKVFFGY